MSTKFASFRLLIVASLATFGFGTRAQSAPDDVSVHEPLSIGSSIPERVQAVRSQAVANAKGPMTEQQRVGKFAQWYNWFNGFNNFRNF